MRSRFTRQSERKGAAFEQSATSMEQDDPNLLQEEIAIVVDSTTAPPPISFPFEYGVDVSLHSATKYM